MYGAKSLYLQSKVFQKVCVTYLTYEGTGKTYDSHLPCVSLVLKMDCFWAEVTAGHLELKEAEASKWLTKDKLDSVAWLPADITLIDEIRKYMK